MTTDAEGNVYVTGFASGTIDGQPALGGLDALLVKYDASGERLWARLWGTSSEDLGMGVAVAADGNIYVAGRTRATLPGETSAGSDDAMLAKFNSAGALQWARQFGSAAGEDAAALMVAGDHIYVTGVTEGQLSNVPSSGGRDLFVARFDDAGAQSWVRVLGTDRADYGYGIDVSEDGSIFVAGATYGELDGENSGGGRDALLAKFNSSDGSLEWAKQFGTAADDNGSEVMLGGSDVYVAGYTGGDLNGENNAGENDVFLMKLGTNGELQWTRLFGTSADDGLGTAALTVVQDGAILVAGSTLGMIAGVESYGDLDGFVAEFDSGGEALSALGFGTSLADSVRSVATSGGSVYVTGETTGSFGSTPNAGQSDLFVMRLE